MLVVKNHILIELTVSIMNTLFKRVSQTEAMNTTKNITYTDIQNSINSDAFIKASTGDFSVILLKANGYVNATRMCKAAGKKYTDWKKEANSMEYAELLCKMLDRSPEDLVIRVKTIEHDIKGVYVHPQLILNIAVWCSFECQCNLPYIVWDYNAKLATADKDDTINKMKEMLAELQNHDKSSKECLNRVKRLRDEVDIMNAGVDIIIDTTEVTYRNLDKANDKINKTSDKISKASDKLNEVNDKINKASDKISKASNKINEVNDKLDTIISILQNTIIGSDFKYNNGYIGKSKPLSKKHINISDTEQ